MMNDHLSESKSLAMSTLSLKSQTSEDNKEAYAYVPYLYAKGCIAKIVEDMKNMKNNHVQIVHEIEKHYRAIEDETQVVSHKTVE